MPFRTKPRIELARVLTVAFLALTSAGCDRKAARQAAAPGAEPLSVRLVPIQTRSVDRVVEVSGTLFGDEEVSIAAEVPGRVVAIEADLGDTVEHAGLLARIDPTDYQLAVDEQMAALTAALAKIGLDAIPDKDIDLSLLPLVARADAQESNARARLERARNLYDRTPRMVSEQDFADIQTQSQVATTDAAVERLNARALIAEARVRATALRVAEQRLADTRVVAPRERPLVYRVAARLVSAGEVVAEGQALYRLVASERVKFRGLVPGRYASQVGAGARAELLVDGFPTPFGAVVARVAPAVDIATRSFEVEIEAENPDGALKPGSFVRARIVVGVEPGARFVPEGAVYQFAGVQRLYTVADGRVVEHQVRLGEPRDGVRELLDAPAGIEFVIDGARSLRAGAPVTVLP